MRTRIGIDENYQGVYLDDKQRTLGIFINGATGGGKSTLDQVIMYDDVIYNKRSCIVIDPAGPLGEFGWSIKHDMYVSREYCNAFFNPLMAPYNKSQIIDIVVEIINHVIVTTANNEQLTVHMKNLLAQTIEWCLDNGRPRLDAVRDRLKTNSVAGSLTMARDGLASRLDSILTDQAVHRILCTEKPFDFVEFTKNRRFLILDTFGMSIEKSVFVGSTLSYLLRAYFRNTRQKKYYPLSFIVDEAHLFVNSTFYDIIKEGRKYQLMITLSTQDFANIPETFTHTLLSNVGTIVALNPGSVEAKRIAPELNIEWQSVKFTEKYYGMVKTPSFTGVLKMNRPPLVRLKPLPVHKEIKHAMWFSSN